MQDDAQIQNTQTEVPEEADGYYGEDELDDEELDLSFLDDESAQENEKPVSESGQADQSK